ncbi:MAG: hypothetical protein ABSG98_13130 [Anaerolineales bacterium]
MDASQKEQLFSNLTEPMQRVPARTVVGQLVHFYKADPKCGRGVAKKLGLEHGEVCRLGQALPCGPDQEDLRVEGRRGAPRQVHGREDNGHGLLPTAGGRVFSKMCHRGPSWDGAGQVPPGDVAS